MSMMSKCRMVKKVKLFKNEEEVCQDIIGIVFFEGCVLFRLPKVKAEKYVFS